MKPATTRTRILALSFIACSGCAELLGMNQAPATPPSEPSSASTPRAAATVSAASPGTDASTRSSAEPADDAKPASVKLDAFELPLTIDVPRDTALRRRVGSKSGVEVGDLTSETQVYVVKADASIKTVAKAKARKRVSGCDAQTVVEEGPDYYIYRCKMRSMAPLELLMLKEIGGVVYACESNASVESPAELQKHLAVCRTLQPL